MKNLLQIVIVTIIASFLFSSCARNMSIAKRKYNKGYYISHTGKKPEVSNKKTAIGLKHEKADTKDEVATNAGSNVAAPVANQNEVIAESAIEQATMLSHKQSAKHKEAISKKEKFVYNTFAKHTGLVSKIERITGNKNLSSKIQTKLSTGGDAAGDVLSLFWIVLLILLLFYLIGLLFEGFGLGWAFHIIGLVLLILFILWLLRVV